jgi:PAS domain S-box-containing protein
MGWRFDDASEAMQSVEPAVALRWADMAEELAGVGYWWMDAATQAIRWSPNMYRIFGLEPGVVPALDYAMQFVHPDDRAAADANLERNLLGGSARSATRIVQPSGQIRYVEGRNACEFAPDGAVLAVYGTMHDVTDRIASEKALAESEARYRLLAEAASDVVLKVNADDVIEYASPSIRRYGWAPENMIGELGASFIHPDDVARVISTVEMLALGHGVASARDRSYRIRKADGGYTWIEANSSVVRHTDGSVRAVICQLRDITERRAAQQALMDSEARYRLLAENATDVTFCFQPDGKITFVTPAVQRLLGYEPAELIGRPPSDIMHPDDRDRVRKAFSDYVAQGPGAEPIRIEFRAQTRDGRELWLEAHPRTLFDASGVLIEVQDVIRDITARKQMERDLLTAKETAEAATAVKAEFLSNISHDLRTPLTAIIGYSGLLAEIPDLSEPVRRHTERIESAGRTLLSLVNGILDFSRLEAGQLTLSAQACSPARIARECLDLLALAAEAKGVQLEYFEADGVPPSLLIDPDAYRQVLANLIGNAVKFTDAGFVRLTVEYNANTSRLFVSVEDTGDGIPRAEIGKLFRRFSQVDGASTRKHSGAGLGLAICKGLVEAMGGDISVMSEPGVGSVFSFRVPATQAHTIAAAADATERPEAGVRILIAEDNASVRELVRAVLENCGSEVTEAVDGVAAIEAATSQPFDLILLDLRMPGAAGQDVASTLRARRGPNANIPIIAFTASPEALDETFRQRSGFDDTLAKPVVVRDLLSLVARYTGSSTHPSTRGHAA